MPDEWANALAPTMALFGCTGMPVMLADQAADASRSRVVLMPVVTSKRSLRVSQRHHDLFQRRVAGALADAVDGALDLPRAVACTPASALAVAMPRSLWQCTEIVAFSMPRTFSMMPAISAPNSSGYGVAGRVGDVDDGRAGGDDRLHHPIEVLRVGATGVLGIELDVLDILPGVLDRGCAALQRLFAGHAQLVLQMTIGHAEAGVDAGPGGAFQGLGGDVDILFARARQPADHAVADLGRDELHRFEVAGGRDREPGLDNVDAQMLQGVAMRIFSSTVIAAPGDCSPSRRVVSKMCTLSILFRSFCRG